MKQPPQLNVSVDDIDYLEGIGVSVQDGQASDGGLSGVLGNPDGAPPIGVTATPAVKMSSAPPLALGGLAPVAPPFASALTEAPSVDAPNFGEFAPLVASAPEIATTIAEPFDGETVAEPEPIPEPEPPVEFQTPQTTNPFRQSVPVDIPVKQKKAQEPPQPHCLDIPIESWDGPVASIGITAEGHEIQQSAGSVLMEAPPPLPLPQQEATSPAGSLTAPPTTRIKLLPKVSQISTGGNVNSFELPTAPPNNDLNRDDGVSTIPVQTESARIEQVSDERLQDFQNISVRQSVEFAAPKQEKRVNNAVVSFAPPRKIQPTVVQSQQDGLVTRPDNQNPNVAALPPVPELALATSENSTFIESQRIDAQSNDNVKVRRAFVQLSRFFEQKQYNEAEQKALMPVLDKLALDVIYAKDTHILEEPYLVRDGETIESVAANYSLTPQLLRNINGYAANQQPTPGSRLKVLAGQFDAVVSSKRKEMVLLLGGLYAGRVPIIIGNKAVMQSGEFYVVSKSEAKVLTLSNGVVLGGSVVHSVGSPGMTILLNNKDAKEVFDILSPRSVVVFER
ncbi:hypothetical protein FACS1894170_11450 [Planctomycetales bacterium]|nr:hypothetical protein FACS1894170_11450 [Planctomycetales bacterium]